MEQKYKKKDFVFYLGYWGDKNCKKGREFSSVN